MAIDTSVRIRLIDGFSAGLLGMQTGVRNVSSSLASMARASEIAGNFNQAAEGAGRFAAMTRAAVEGPVMAFAGFESSMLRVAAMSNEVGTPAFAAMSAEARRLGDSTSFTAAQAADAMGNFAVAGLTATQIMQATGPALNVAAAAGADLDQTASILGRTVNGLGLEMTQMARVGDVLTAAMSTSDNTLLTLGSALEAAAPGARQANTSIETLAASLAVLGNSGIQASQAGTSMNTVLASLMSPAGEGAKALQRLGFRGAELVGLQQQIAGGDLPGALARIGQSMDGLTDDRRIRALQGIFGREGFTAGSILIQASLDEGDRGLRAYQQRLEESGGTAERIAGTMQSGITGELTRLGSAAEGVAISIGEQFAPQVRSLATSLQGVAGQIGEWSSNNTDLVSTTGTVLIGLTGFSLAIRGVALAASYTTTTFGIMSGGLSLVGDAAAWTTATLGGRLVPALAATRLGAALAASPLGTAAVSIRGMGAAAATALGPFGLAAVAIGALALAATQIKSPEGKSLVDGWSDILGDERGVFRQIGDGISDLMGQPTSGSVAEQGAAARRRAQENTDRLNAERRAGGGAAEAAPEATPAAATPSRRGRGGAGTPAAPTASTTPSALSPQDRTMLAAVSSARGSRGGGNGRRETVELGPQSLGALSELNTTIQSMVRALRAGGGGPRGTEPLGT